MNNIYVLDKNYKKIGTLSNQGANPQAPYYEDLYTQELETGADTYQFSTTSSKYTQDILEIGNHIMFAYKNRNELFTITSLEYSHYEGYKTIGVYAEGIGFDLLEIYMKRPENEKDEGGRDEDNDGDTSTDDEYADLDDMYLDENGIIVYDKDGSGPPKEEDMYVDENGIIVYRRNKRNRDKDSLEFKNISYSRFLSILLKNTGWSYVCQPGLENIKHDITVRYDTNIFALLQDSMQSYRGVELEFVHELVGGRVQRVIKAYKDGGRGSFVGKRFEYGTNVRGITKMQEVANSEDDTILYVDNVGIAVQYDVDFALKSAEVPEIEIGDTHYVIDRDFYPPMQIKARIGKIEISFSDPTKNKIYLANNKRISGSAIEDEFGADDVADMLDDYDPGTDDPINPEPNDPIVMSDALFKAPRMHSYEFLLYTNRWGSENYSVSERMNDYGKIGSAGAPASRPTPTQLYDFIMNEAVVYECSPVILDEIEGTRDSNYCLRLFPQNYCDYNNSGSCEMSVAASRIFSEIINEETDLPDFHPISKSHYDNHMLDVGSLACATVTALQQHLEKDHAGDESDFWEKKKSDGLYAGALITAKDKVTFPYGIYFDNTSPNHSEHTIQEAGYISTRQISYMTKIAWSDESLKENIRYIDAATTTYSNEDLLEKADLYDFIVNQVNICEYNFIGDDVKQIGFIANEYEGSKLGDRIILRDERKDVLTYNVDNLLFATIGALQEEVRTKDEKIASLEARLAKIEAILGINDNDN